jgi:hypothetical protein
MDFDRLVFVLVGVRFVGVPSGMMVIPQRGQAQGPLIHPTAPLVPNKFSHPPSVMSCHPERSEGSDWPGTEILRCAQDDKIVRSG